MADIAALGFDVDTNTLELAAKKLNALAPAAANAKAGADSATAALNTTGTAASKAAAGLSSTGTAATAATGQIGNIAPAANEAAAGLTRMQNAANGNTRSLGAMKANTANIAAQFQDVGVTAAMGMAPLQIALQQGTQLAQVFAGMKPAEAVGALASGFGSLLSPVSLATIAIIGLSAAAIQYFSTMFDGGEKSAAVLKKEAELIQKVAEQWGVALPALKAYADEQQRLVDQQNQLDALIAARGQNSDALLAGFSEASGELADIQDKLITIGENQAANQLRSDFDALQQKVKDGTATQEDFNQILDESKTVFAAAGINGNGFITMLANLAGQASVTLKTMAGLNAEIDKAFGGAGSNNGRSIRGLKLGADGVVTLPDNAPTPDNAPNREDVGAANDRLAARLAKANAQHGKTDAEKFADIVTGADNAIAKLQAEQDALGMTAEAAATLKYETELLNQANQKGLELSPQERDELHGKAVAMAELATETKNAKAAMDFAKDTFKGFLSDFEQGIEQGKGFWKSFGDAALGALNKIVDKLLNDVIDALFQVNSAAGGGGGGLLGSILGLFTGGGGGGGLFARGAVFDRGVEKFASGGVVDRPTTFGMSGGRTGLMGEAGPETIMPIKRMGNGDMGVAATLPRSGGNDNTIQPVVIAIQVGVSGVNGDKQIQDAVEKGVSAGLEKFDQHILPARVNEISRDSRVR